MTLGQRIQELRKQKGLSQEGLGEMLGVSRQAISRWEMDGAVPEVLKASFISLGSYKVPLSFKETATPLPKVVQASAPDLPKTSPATVPSTLMQKSGSIKGDTAAAPIAPISSLVVNTK